LCSLNSIEANMSVYGLSCQSFSLSVCLSVCPSHTSVVLK